MTPHSQPGRILVHDNDGHGTITTLAERDGLYVIAQVTPAWSTVDFAADLSSAHARLHERLVGDVVWITPMPATALEATSDIPQELLTALWAYGLTPAAILTVPAPITTVLTLSRGADIQAVFTHRGHDTVFTVNAGHPACCQAYLIANNIGEALVTTGDTPPLP